MILNVYYGNIKKTFKGDNASKLFEQARKHKLYKEHSEITFEIEEVNEYGDKCSEC